VVEWRGKPVGTTWRSFSNLVHELGLSDDVVCYTLRHTAATWGMHEGVDDWELAGYLGMSVEGKATLLDLFNPASRLWSGAPEILECSGRKCSPDPL
jgi:hypothetical protein